MEKPANKLSHEEIRKKLGLKGDRDPALSEGLLKNMHQLIGDHNLSHVAVGRSIGLNEKESNKFLSYPHLKTFSKDKRGTVRMFFARSDEAKAEVRKLYEKHEQNPNAVAFELGLDLLAVNNLLGKTKPNQQPPQDTGLRVRFSETGPSFKAKDLIYPTKPKKKQP